MKKWGEQLKKIKQCFEYYQKNLCGKTFLIIFSEIDDKKLKNLDDIKKRESLKAIEICFKEENFIHLIGMKRREDTVLSAREIYLKIKNSSLKKEDIELGAAHERKIEVFFKLYDLFNGKIKKAKYNGFKKDNLDVDNILGTDKVQEDIVLGIKNIAKDTFVPASLLKEIFPQLVEGKAKKILYILERENKVKVYKRLNYKDRNFKEEYLEYIVNDRFRIDNELEKNFTVDIEKKFRHQNYVAKENFSDYVAEQLEKIFTERQYKKRNWILEEDIEKKGWKILGKTKPLQIINELNKIINLYNMEKIKITKKR